MEMQQQLYKVSKTMLESTEWHIQQFKDNAKPRAVDAFNNEMNYADRLQWAKELFSIAPQLAQWDWSEFVFTLGPLDIDWNRQTIILPANFDGASFVRYVEEVHKAAKDLKQEELTEDVLMESRVDAATKRINYNGAEPDRIESPEAQRRRTAHGPVRSNVTQGSEQDSDLGRDQLEQQQNAQYAQSDALRTQSLMQTHKQWLQRNNPHLEEYLASSPDGQDQLSVERPLHHNLNFDSDEHSGEVAEDNLKWEGFYSGPYVESVPNRDLDDIAHAYLHTNRKYREEAIKKLVKEVQDRMGSGKRMKDAGYKMGDISGLNNPQLRPKGFPILVRGTARGDESQMRPV